MAKSYDFGVGLMHEVAITASKVGWEPEDMSNFSKDESRMKLVLGVLRGTHEIKSIKIVPEILDLIVRVDRTVRPNYPDWVKKVMHSQIELTGPTEYDLNTLKLWLHDGQKETAVFGKTIYDYLKDNNFLESCLGLADLFAIQAKGITVFRKLYSGKAVFGWKSVVLDSGGSLLVPCLYESGGGVVLSWSWLDGGWGSSGPALRFNK